MDLHNKMSHAGIYSVLSELRKTFWIPSIFSLTKSVVRKCVICRRFNNRNVMINQGSYREFRTDPPKLPYRSVFIDHCGPFMVNLKEKSKVYVLLFTCLWSRSVNLVLCRDLTEKSFIEAFQIHCLDYGIPENIYSDLGSQIVSGATMITELLNDKEVTDYLRENGIKKVIFEHYDKGKNELGSLVEIMVKLVKRLLFGAVRNLILDYFQFEFFVRQTKHLVNRRPIGFKESLRDTTSADLPPVITPEMLVHGQELPSVNIVPWMQRIYDDEDLDWSPDSNRQNLAKDYNKIIKARERLSKLYNDEFMDTLLKQSTNQKGRYSPVNHCKLEPGDIVLIKDPLIKLNNLPMAIVRSVTTNDHGEVTAVSVYKGSTREEIRRHVSSLVLLLRKSECIQDDKNASRKLSTTTDTREIDHRAAVRRTSRKAGRECKKKIKALYQQDEI